MDRINRAKRLLNKIGIDLDIELTYKSCKLVKIPGIFSNMILDIFQKKKTHIKFSSEYNKENGKTTITTEDGTKNCQGLHSALKMFGLVGGDIQ